MLFHHEASEGMKQHNLPPLWISDVLVFSSVHICTCSCTQKPWSLAGSLFLSHSVSVFKALTPVSSHCNTKWTHGGRLRYQLPSAIWFPFNTLHSLLSVPLRRMAAMNKFTSTFWAVSWWSYLKWFTQCSSAVIFHFLGVCMQIITRNVGTNIMSPTDDHTMKCWEIRFYYVRPLHNGCRISKNSSIW